VDDEPASWLVIATYGATGEYLAATSLPPARSRNCGQFLTWTAMLHLRARGFRSFDLGGFAPENHASGVSRFKRGTSAVPYRFCSEIDAFQHRNEERHPTGDRRCTHADQGSSRDVRTREPEAAGPAAG
jgi:hypothetical protein